MKQKSVYCYRICIMKSFKKFVESFNIKNRAKANFAVSEPESFGSSQDLGLLKGLSKHALKLYEHQTDVKNFKKLVLSDPENLDYEKRVKELLENNNVKDVLSEETLDELLSNEKLLNDLGIDEQL